MNHFGPRVCHRQNRSFRATYPEGLKMYFFWIVTYMANRMVFDKLRIAPKYHHDAHLSTTPPTSPTSARPQRKHRHASNETCFCSRVAPIQNVNPRQYYTKVLGLDNQSAIFALRWSGMFAYLASDWSTRCCCLWIWTWPPHLQLREEFQTPWMNTIQSRTCNCSDREFQIPWMKTIQDRKFNCSDRKFQSPSINSIQSRTCNCSGHPQRNYKTSTQ